MQLMCMGYSNLENVAFKTSTDHSHPSNPVASLHFLMWRMFCSVSLCQSKARAILQGIVSHIEMLLLNKSRLLVFLSPLPLWSNYSPAYPPVVLPGLAYLSGYRLCKSFSSYFQIVCLPINLSPVCSKRKFAAHHLLGLSSPFPCFWASCPGSSAKLPSCHCIQKQKRRVFFPQDLECCLQF